MFNSIFFLHLVLTISIYPIFVLLKFAYIAMYPQTEYQCVTSNAESLDKKINRILKSYILIRKGLGLVGLTTKGTLTSSLVALIRLVQSHW